MPVLAVRTTLSFPPISSSSFSFSSSSSSSSSFQCHILILIPPSKSSEVPTIASSLLSITFLSLTFLTTTSLPIATSKPSSPSSSDLTLKSDIAVSVFPPKTAVLSLLIGFPPGLNGGSEASYVRHLFVRARSKGWRVVVFNNRGCGNSPVTTPQLYSASVVGDMREVVSHVNTLYSDANIYAAGWSLGANVLVRYLGQMRHL